jgi:hypothetical protein
LDLPPAYVPTKFLSDAIPVFHNLIASKSVHNVYESVEDFEQKTSIQLPEDIAAMLTQPQNQNPNLYEEVA